ncbi:MAG: DEAD/DEAH box helicase [Mycobacteriales bacterium]
MSPSRKSLRPYQRKAIEGLRADWAADKRRVLLVMPTGTGKTYVSVILILDELKAGGRVLYLAHRRELVDQAYRGLLGEGLSESEVGVIMATDKRANPKARVQIASIDTLRHRHLPKATLVVEDEAHHAMSDGRQELAKRYPKARWLGMTATPWRLDGKDLSDAYESLVDGGSLSSLMADEYVMRPIVRSKALGNLPDLRGVKSQAGDYNQRELARRVNRKELVGDIIAHWKKYAGGKPTVCFATGVKHSKSIVRSFKKAGIKAEHLDGETPAPDRDAILERLAGGQVKIVSNCMVLGEAWDLPAVRVMISARPTKSLTLWLQQCGRVMRPWVETSGEFRGQKLNPLILDHAGNAWRLGLPETDRPMELAAGCLSRGGGEAPVKRCENCETLSPAGLRVCPVCHTPFPEPAQLEEVEGELEVINRPSDEELRADLAHIEAVLKPIARDRGIPNIKEFARKLWIAKNQLEGDALAAE